MFTLISQAPADKPSKSGAKGEAATSIHGFDPVALERAAKAARELDQAKNSKGALEIIQAQELTKQKESEMERAKYMAMQQELAIRRVQEEGAALALRRLLH